MEWVSIASMLGWGVVQQSLIMFMALWIAFLHGHIRVRE